MENNEKETIMLKFNHKDKAEIGVFAGATIVGLLFMSSVLHETRFKLRFKYSKWKLKRLYKKVLNDPNLDEKTRNEIMEKIKECMESK
jgi:hypothetical protein